MRGIVGGSLPEFALFNRRLSRTCFAPHASVSGENSMNLHTPSVPLFVTSLVFAALALIGHFVLLPFITLYGFWVAIIAYVILALGIVMKT